MSKKPKEEMPAMPVFKIRLKHHPDKYVGKKDPTYAVHSDQTNGHNHPQIDAHWYVSEAQAKIWTSVTHLRRFLGFCRNAEGDTFSLYELIVLSHKGSKVIELDYSKLDNRSIDDLFKDIREGKTPEKTLVKEMDGLIKTHGMQNILHALVENVKKIESPEEYIKTLHGGLATVLKTYIARYDDGKMK